MRDGRTLTAGPPCRAGAVGIHSTPPEPGKSPIRIAKAVALKTVGKRDIF